MHFIPTQQKWKETDGEGPEPGILYAVKLFWLLEERQVESACFMFD